MTDDDLIDAAKLHEALQELIESMEEWFTHQLAHLDAFQNGNLEAHWKAGKGKIGRCMEALDKARDALNPKPNRRQ